MKRTLLILMLLLMCLWVSSSSAVMQTDGKNKVRCFVNASTATILTAMGGSCAAPGAGLSIYLTDITFGSSVASGTTADSAPTMKYGTGGTCGTGTTSVWAAAVVANSSVTEHFITPIKMAANNEVCFIHSGVGTKWVVLQGYIER